MIFKSFHLRNLKRALKHERPVVEPNTYDSVEISSRSLDFCDVGAQKRLCIGPVTKIENFDDVPDQILIIVLRYLDINALCKVRMVSKRLDKIVQRHHDSFAKRSLESIGLIRLPFGSADKITIASIRHTSLDSLAIALSPKQLDSALRHIRVTEHLSVENLAFTRLNCHMLQRSIANQLARLQLIGCRLEIGYEEFARFVGRWKVRDLSLIECDLDDAQLIGDVLFRLNPQLQSFTVDGEQGLRLPCLTNSTLQSWSQALDERSFAFPQSFCLGVAKPNFTIDGICSLIEQFIKKPPKINYPVIWNFGIVRGRRRSMVDYLNAFQHISLIETEPNELWVIFSGRAALHVRVAFEGSH